MAARTWAAGWFEPREYSSKPRAASREIETTLNSRLVHAVPCASSSERDYMSSARWPAYFAIAGFVTVALGVAQSLMAHRAPHAHVRDVPDIPGVPEILSA